MQRASDEPNPPAAPSAAAPGLLARIADSDLLYSFRQSRIVMLAAAVTLLMVAAALLAPVIAPHNPYDLITVNLLDSNFAAGVGGGW